MLRIAFHVYSIVFFSLLLLQPVHAKPAQAFGQKIEVLSLNPVISQDKVRPGDSFKLGIQITMFDEWHINSNRPSEEFLIPTVLELEAIWKIEMTRRVGDERVVELGVSRHARGMVIEDGANVDC